ncbi:MAG: hypothetical protein RL660_1605 [Bacteroidota bacterium]|jgi:putative transcriptional regulator
MRELLGKTLIATDILAESYFEASEILIVEHNVDGAVGFVMNKLYDHKLSDLVEFSDSKPLPLHEGGPVEQDMLYFIHHGSQIVVGGKKVNKHWFYGGDFGEAVQLLNSEVLDGHSLKVFVGYCGWDAGQLEDELEEGCWEISDN